MVIWRSLIYCLVCVVYVLTSIGYIELIPKPLIPCNYMYFLDHAMKEIKGTYNNKTTHKFRRKKLQHVYCAYIYYIHIYQIQLKQYLSIASWVCIQLITSAYFVWWSRTSWYWQYASRIWMQDVSHSKVIMT